MTGEPPQMGRIERASQWSWRLAVVALAVALGAVTLAVLGRISGGERTLAPLPALAIPLVVVVAMAALITGSLALRWATRELDSDGFGAAASEEIPSDGILSDGDLGGAEAADGVLWRAWRRSVRAVMVSGILVLGAPIVLLLTYAAV